MTIPNGPYHYFLPNCLDIPPRLCEIEGKYAWFAGEERGVPVDKLSGTFIRLVETGLPITVKPIVNSQNLV